MIEVIFVRNIQYIAHYKRTIIDLSVANNYRFICLQTTSIIDLIVTQFMFFRFRPIICLDTLNSNKVISYVIAIGLYKYFKTDMIIRSNVVLRSYAAFSCFFLFWKRPKL